MEAVAARLSMGTELRSDRVNAGAFSTVRVAARTVCHQLAVVGAYPHRAGSGGRLDRPHQALAADRQLKV